MESKVGFFRGSIAIALVDFQGVVGVRPKNLGFPPIHCYNLGIGFFSTSNPMRGLDSLG